MATRRTRCECFACGNPKGARHNPRVRTQDTCKVHRATLYRSFVGRGCDEHVQASYNCFSGPIRAFPSDREGADAWQITTYGHGVLQTSPPRVSSGTIGCQGGHRSRTTGYGVGSSCSVPRSVPPHYNRSIPDERLLTTQPLSKGHGGPKGRRDARKSVHRSHKRASQEMTRETMLACGRFMN